MNTVSDVLGNAGSPVQGTLADGRTFTVMRMDQSIKTRVEQHLKAVARAQIMADRAELSDVEFQLVYGAFLDRVASSDYKFGGSIYLKFMTSSAGGVYVARALIRVAGKEMAEEELSALLSDPANEAAVKAAIDQAMAESFPKGSAPVRDPGTSEPGKLLPL